MSQPQTTFIIPNFDHDKVGCSFYDEHKSLLGISKKGISTLFNYIYTKTMDKIDSLTGISFPLLRGNEISLREDTSDQAFRSRSCEGTKFPVGKTTYEKIKDIYYKSDKLGYKEYKKINKLMIEEFRTNGDFEYLEDINYVSMDRLKWLKWFELFVNCLMTVKYCDKYKLDDIPIKNYEYFFSSKLYDLIQHEDYEKNNLGTIITFIMNIVLENKHDLLRSLLELHEILYNIDLNLEIKGHMIAWNVINEKLSNYRLETFTDKGGAYSEAHIIEYGDFETRTILLTSNYFNENLPQCLLIRASCMYDEINNEYINKSILNTLPKEIISIIISNIILITGRYKEHRCCKRCNINYKGKMGFDESYDYCNKCLLWLMKYKI